MVVQMKTMNTLPVRRISGIIKDYADNNFPEGYDVSIAGYADMENAMTTLITGSQISSLIISLILVFIIVALSFKSFSAGILGIIPLSFAIMINFAVMGFTGIRLDMVTAMIASIAVGIGIDYTIHFISAYRNERALSEDLNTVTEKPCLQQGKQSFLMLLQLQQDSLYSVFQTLQHSNISESLSHLQCLHHLLQH